MKFFKGFIMVLLVAAVPAVIQAQPVMHESNRMAMIFDDMRQPSQTVPTLDATTIDLLALIHEKSMSFVVSTVIAAQLFEQGELFNSAGKTAKNERVKKTVGAAKAAYDEFMSYVKQSAKNGGLTPKIREQIQDRLSRMSQTEQGDVWSSLLPTALHDFKDSDWTIKQITKDLLLFVPHSYDTSLSNDVPMVQDKALTEREYKLGLKIDHLPTITIAAAIKGYMLPSAHPWMIIDTIFSEQSQLFVTNAEYRAAGKTQRPWIFMMLGHGFQFSYAEYAAFLLRKENAPYQKTLDMLKAIEKPHQEFLNKFNAFAQHPSDQQLLQDLYKFLTGDYTDKLQDIADATESWCGLVLNVTYLPYVVGRISKTLSGPAKKALNSSELELLKKRVQSLTDYLATAKQLITDAFCSTAVPTDKTGKGNHFLDELIGGRFCGMYHDQIAQVLTFFNDQVQTKLLLYVTCFGGGEKRDYVFDTLLGNKKLNYTVIAGSLTDAPARGRGYQVFDASNNIVEENGTVRFVIPYPKDFAFAFDAFETKDTKKYVQAVDKVHPVLPIRQWINNLPFIRAVGATEFSLLALDGSVQQISKAKSDATTDKAVEACLLYTKDLATLELPQLAPVLVPMDGEGTYKIGLLKAPKTTLNCLLEACYGVQADKKEYTYQIDSAQIAVDGRLAKLLAVQTQETVTLEQVEISHNQAAGLQGPGGVDRIAFKYKGNSFAAECPVGQDFFFTDLSGLMQSLKKVPAPTFA